MSSVFASTAACDSRTSLGDPVDPDVESSRARSGCNSCAASMRRCVTDHRPSRCPPTLSGSCTSTICPDRPGAATMTACPASNAPGGRRWRPRRGELDQHEPPTATHLAPAEGGVGHACRERGIRDGRGPRVECGEYPWVDSWRTKPTAAGAAGCSGRVVVMAKVRLTSPSPVVESGFRRGTPDPQCGHPVESAITFGRVSPVMPMYAATAALIIE